MTFGTDGLLTHWEVFDADSEDAALARFDELTTEPAEPRFANAASRVNEQSRRAFEQRDWDALVRLYAPEHVFDDRRPLVRVRVEGEAFFADLRRLFHAWRKSSFHLIATRGDRLALHRHTLTSVSGEAGPAEFEMLHLVEVDAAGRRVALVTFDLCDLDAAHADLDERYAAGEAAAYPRAWEMSQPLRRDIASRDWEQMTSAYTGDFIFEDHRLLGWGTRSRDELVAQVRAMVELAPDVTLRIDHALAINRLGVLNVARWVGTRDGGAFEIPTVNAALLSPDGRIRRIDAYDLDQLDEARARFAELQPDPTRIPPNAASRACDRNAKSFLARDGDALRAIVSDDFLYEDRSKHALLSGDVEMWIASVMFLVAESAARIEHELLGTVGDRIAIHYIAFRDASDATRFELDRLRITEVDAEGKLRAVILFDLDDRSAAFDEAQARFVAGEAAATGGQAPLLAWSRAIARRDWEAAREALTPDLVHHDHHTLLAGSYDRDQYVESMRTWRDLAPDAGLEELRILAWSRHGRVGVARSFGTLRDGGGAFENIMVFVALTRGDRIQQLELFDVADADRALARFEELCAAQISTRRDAP